ncbi:MAG: hypothetical protein LBF90_03140 [Prevotellaceae bacterium]|nr:hypothetical protein [Prevotellaceae bacterium]
MLHGTPPFVINGSIRESSYTFDDAGVCITSITDSTGCPGFVVNPPIVPGSIPSTGETVCAGDTPATIVGLMPFGGGDGPLAYSWYKDNVLIPAATGADATSPATYTWFVGDATSFTIMASIGATTYATPSLAVGSTYNVTIRNSTGCVSETAYGTVTIHTAVATASISGSSSNTCPASTVSLSASASGATSFTWYKNGTQVQTDTSSAYTVTSSGSYTVQGKNANCTGTTSSSKVVTINSCGNVTGCSGLQLYQTTSAYDGNGNWSAANSYCTSRGARLPTVTELVCMCTYQVNMPGGFESYTTYWSSTRDSGNFVYFVYYYSGICTTDSYDASVVIYFRCVL